MKTQPIRRFSLSRWTFRSTLVPAWLFWVVACATAVAAGVGVAYFGSPDSGTPLETSAPARSSPVAESSATEEDVIAAEPPADQDDTADAALGGSDGGGGQSGFAAGLSRFEGTSIQVLNASTDEAAAESMASVLTEEGFSVELVETARRIYRRTTVFWTPSEGRSAALALAEHFGWRTARKPDTLTDDIPVHVVVGEDEIS